MFVVKLETVSFVPITFINLGINLRNMRKQASHTRENVVHNDDDDLDWCFI